MITRLYDRVQVSVYSTREVLHKHVVVKKYR